MITTYLMSDGKEIRGYGIHHDGEKWATEYCQKHPGVKIVQVVRGDGPRRKRDGFPDSPHFNNALGCVVKNKAHYYDILKARGLVEVGNELVIPEHKRPPAGYFTSETVREMKREIPTLGDNWLDHMIQADARDEIDGDLPAGQRKEILDEVCAEYGQSKSGS